MTLSRKAGREAALTLLYQWDVTGRPLGSLFEGELDEFARATADAVAAEAEQLDARISAASVGWPAERLGAVERNVLRIAIHELDSSDVPRAVAIDEAVRLAKRFATDDAARLVNGILDKIAKERAA